MLDSEGIDSAFSEGFHDHQIFTLVVLLANVLVYNSQNVVKRKDLEGLEYPFINYLWCQKSVEMNNISSYMFSSLNFRECVTRLDLLKLIIKNN